MDKLRHGLLARGFKFLYCVNLGFVIGSVLKRTCFSELTLTIFFLDFPICLQAAEIHSANGVMGGEGG
jgi:hypothetical protein